MTCILNALDSNSQVSIPCDLEDWKHQQAPVEYTVLTHICARAIVQVLTATVIGMMDTIIDAHKVSHLSKFHKKDLSPVAISDGRKK